MIQPQCVVANPFELFYAEYRKLVYGTALRVLREPGEAEDVVQIIFLRICSRPGLFRGGNVAGWLTTLAKNCAIDRLRRKTRERTHAEAVSTPLADDVEALAIRRLDREWVRDALGGLPEVQRALLLDIYFDGRSHREIARATGVPLGTVKTRARSGLSHLRRAAIAAALCA